MIEFLLLEGDMQSGTDKLVIEPCRLATEAFYSGVILLDGDEAGYLNLEGDALERLILEPMT